MSGGCTKRSSDDLRYCAAGYCDGRAILFGLVVVTSATATTGASKAASAVTGEAPMTIPAMVNETAAGKAAVSTSAIATPIAAHIGGAHIRRAIIGSISAVLGIIVIAGRAIVITIIGGTDWHADADTNMD
jgi:hypothetical protein